MGHEINGGVNNDSLAKLKAIIADGKLESKELQGLTDTEKAALEKYLKGEGKELPKEGEITYLKEPEEHKYDSNGEILWNAIAKAVPKAIANLLALTPLGLQACDKTTVVEGTHVENNTNVSFEIKQDYNALVDAVKDLTKLIKENAKKDDENYKEVIALITSLISSLNANGEKLDQVVNYLKQQGITLEEIVQALKESGKNDIEILNALKNAGTQLGDIAVQLKDNKVILEEISGKSTKIYNALTKLVAQGDKISGEYKTILNNILNKIGSQADLTKVEDMLASILNKLEQQIANGEKASEVDQAFYDAVLAKLDKMTAEQEKFFNKILTKLDGMNSDQAELVKKLLAAIEKNTSVSEKTFEIANKILAAMDKVGGKDKDYSDILNKILDKLGTINSGNGGTSSTDLSKVEALLDAILAKIEKGIENQDKMSADNAQAFNDLLDAINENTKVAKGTFEVANKILAAMDKLGDKADEAINVLKELSKGNDKDCNFNPEDFKAFITATVQGMMTTFKEQHQALINNNDKNTKDILSKLDDILKAIEEGKCNCDHTGLLAKLEIIINKMDNSEIDDNTHEGIIGDLEDIFG